MEASSRDHGFGQSLHAAQPRPQQLQFAIRSVWPNVIACVPRLFHVLCILPAVRNADPCIHVMAFVIGFLPADALGWLAYLRPATEQLQRLDISNNSLLRLNSCSKRPKPTSRQSVICS